MRWLSTAEGVQLDGIGTILGLTRVPGQTDAAYRELLYFQVFINKSTATPEEAIATLKFLTKATYIQYQEPYPAYYQMFTNGLPQNFSIPPDEIVLAIQSISAAGVQYVPIICNFGIDPTFQFSSDPILQDFYVAPDPDNLETINPFEVTPDNITDYQFQVNTGETLLNPNGGWFAEDGYVQPGAGYMTEVLSINGSLPLP